MGGDCADLTRRGLLGLLGATTVTALAGCSGSSTTPTAAPATGAAGRTATTAATPAVPSASASPPTLDALSSRLSRPLLRSGDSAYAATAKLYNPRFDAGSRPAAIARCTTADDVAACVRFAADGGAPLRLRAGGHSYGGWSSGPGLVADVSGLSTVSVDTAAGTARVGAGARLIDVYAALGARNVAIAAGSCPTVGLTGLTLGGGIGVLARAYGLTCDALTSADIVTADGKLRTVSASADPDLFWALRGGGGGSFGAVTALTVKTRPAPTVQTFSLRWSLTDGAQVLTAWQQWMSRAPDELWSTCKLLTGATADATGASVSGTWIGAAGELTGQLATLTGAVQARPLSRSAGTSTYQQAMLLEAGCEGLSASACVAEALGPGKRQPFAATSAIVSQPLSTAGTQAALRAVTAGAPQGQVQGGVSFDALGGAVAQVRPGDTAFVHRTALASVQFTSTWTDATSDAAPHDAYVRAQRRALQPFVGDAAYVNYADAAIADYATAYWGSNYPRLQAVKKTYDPGELFTFPQAVRPA